jgi:hypothetical protein
MSDPALQVDEVLDKLIREVEASVHAFYRGEVRQHTARVKTDTFRTAARQGLLPLIDANARVSTSGAAAASSTESAFTPDEAAAITRCIMAWLPMGAPTTASKESRCVAAAREMAPTWGEREKARLAMKRTG